MQSLPVLYSFRRCPYAIRARMTLQHCGIDVEHREVLLKDKPAAMLAASAKGTVPVLVHPDGEVLDESMDIIRWALSCNDPTGWLDFDDASLAEMDALVSSTERDFKPNLDRYKYNYHPSSAAGSEQRAEHRLACMEYLQELNLKLSQTEYLFGHRLSYADIAVVPFVRQFANVEPHWFEQHAPSDVQRWLRALLESELFLRVMQKHRVWAANPD